MDAILKYDSERKLERNAELYAYKLANPHATWEAVGKKFGITHQRAVKVFQSETKRQEEIAKMKAKNEEATV